ncbi:MAG: sodium/proline symporter [Planctomycetota bacterium]|nr:sodium/proline symporter [Planctomycetota bacterium]
MGDTAALVMTLVVYKVLLLSVGFWASRRTTTDADFYLGGSGLGPWVAALSSAASSSSAWTLLGVSGVAFTQGVSAIWLLPACMGGFLLNWLVVARPLKRETDRTGAVTLAEYLAEGSPPKRHRAFIVSASLVILSSLLIYVASQFQAAGKTFAEILDMEFSTAVLIGGAVVMVYTISGGFWAASVTDMIQGIVMAAASIAVPLVALIEVGGFQELWNGLGNAGEMYVDPWRGKHGWTLAAFLIGTLGIGLGYPGQPHVVNRFMALRSEKDIRLGTWISIVWGLVIYMGMLLAGWCGRVLVGSMEDGEKILIRLSTDLFSPVFGGIILAAILSAIMSTADSQLLVCGSTVSYDLPKGKGKRRILLNRLTILGLGGAAILAAINLSASIFDSVLFAWSGLGAAFGPLLLVRLSGRKVASSWALASLWTGFLVTLVWMPIKPMVGGLYELVPAFFASMLCVVLGIRR